MNSNVKILVAFDGSALAHIAVEEAVDLAQKSNGSITVLHVTYILSDKDSLNLLKSVESKLRSKRVKYKLQSERSEYVPRRIIRVAMDGAYDLIIMGSRGLNISKSWVLGSVSMKVLESSHLPVLIIK